LTGICEARKGEAINSAQPRIKEEPAMSTKGMKLPRKPGEKGGKGGEPLKKPGTISRKMKQTLELAVEHGIDPKQAYALVNGKIPSKATLGRVKDKARRMSLTAPAMVKLAHQAVRDTLEGKEARYDAVKVFSNGKREAYQEVIVPSYTNKLAAAAMIFDRDQPIKGQQGDQAPSFTHVNMNVYLNKDDRFSATETATETKVIDVEPHE
jgi:hypothetical protein